MAASHMHALTLSMDDPLAIKKQKEEKLLVAVKLFFKILIWGYDMDFLSREFPRKL